VPAGASARAPGFHQAHEIHNSTWLEEHIQINSVHPYHSDEPWRRLHHCLLAFHDEMFEALADTVEGRVVRRAFHGMRPALLRCPAGICPPRGE
jgi:hypothetical protein